MAIDNPAVSLFLNHGFVEVCRDYDVALLSEGNDVDIEDDICAIGLGIHSIWLFYLFSRKV
ncbi:hypothetical protein [Kallipyga gabonensis]|uniref:hypothetical protein n=1 Tax=Kallipyga gabonensis TaxID=1686287 RepID=UPI0012E2F4A9|nr:hypothetical protein [Kallipyga gabonensis]